jgi:hypothetical protein
MALTKSQTGRTNWQLLPLENFRVQFLEEAHENLREGKIHREEVRNLLRNIDSSLEDSFFSNRESSSLLSNSKENTLQIDVPQMGYTKVED